MGRLPEYDRDEVLIATASLFGRLGYEGCSLSDLVAGLGIHRASLYKAFGSKRGAFVAALQHHGDHALPELAAELASCPRVEDRIALAAESNALDLVLVASLERGSDSQIANLIAAALVRLGSAVAWEGDECDSTPAVDTHARTMGFLYVSCRLARRCLPLEDVRSQQRLYVALFNNKGETK